MDGRDPGDRRRAQPPIRRRALGPAPLERPDRDHDPLDKTPARGHRPSPRGARPRRDHHPRRHPRHHPRPHPTRPRRRPAKHQLQQVINEAERLHLQGAHDLTNRHPTKRGTATLRTLAPPTHTKKDLEARFTPSSMTAVSRVPRPTSSSKAKKSTPHGPTADSSSSSTAGSTTTPAGLRKRPPPRPPPHRQAAGPSSASPGATSTTPDPRARARALGL